MKIGDQFYYWARRKGEKGRMVFCELISLSEDKKIARVKLQKQDLIPIRTIETRRLKIRDENQT